MLSLSCFLCLWFLSSHSGTTHSTICSLHLGPILCSPDGDWKYVHSRTLFTRSCTPRFMSPLQTWPSRTCRAPDFALYPLIRFGLIGDYEVMSGIGFLQITLTSCPAPCPSRTRVLLAPGPWMWGFMALFYSWSFLLHGTVSFTLTQAQLLGFYSPERALQGDHLSVSQSSAVWILGQCSLLAWFRAPVGSQLSFES